MAKEIFASLSYAARKSGAAIEFDGTFNTDMSGDDIINATQVIGTSSETLNLGEISGAPGSLVIKNLDATNFVTIGGDSGLTVFSLKIPAGKFAFIQPTSGTIYAKADTAAVRVQILAAEL